MTPAEAARRNAAIYCMQRFAHDQGFKLGEVREVDKDTHVELIATTPDGRDFGIQLSESRRTYSLSRRARNFGRMAHTILLVLCAVGGVAGIATGVAKSDVLTGIAGALILAASLIGLLS